MMNISPYIKVSLSHNIVAIACFVLCTLLTLPVFAQDKKVVLEKKKQQVQINIHKLQEKIRGHEDAITTKDNEESYLLRELEELDKRLSTTQAKLFDLELQISDQKEEIRLKELDLSQAETINDAMQEHLEKRLKIYYTTSQVDFLNIAFSSKSLNELLFLQDAFEHLIAYDKDIILSYRKTIQDLENSKTALTLEEEVLNGFLEQLQDEENSLASAKKQKQQLLKGIRGQKNLYAQAIKEMQEASKHLVSELDDIKEEQDVVNNTFLQMKGQLPPPVKGKVITRFGEEKDNALGVSHTSSGIALKVDDGTHIRAISDGKVVYSGYLRGYGNTVVVHHGYQYYTVTARIEQLACKKGDHIRLGSIIGVSGDTATVIDDGLYFEVRHGKTSLNPLFWLDPNLLH